MNGVMNMSNGTPLPVLPALPLEMLLYTSFSRVGFTLLTSRGVPKQISQAFLSRIVQQHWDAYQPLPYKDRAGYLYQLSQQHVIFGWLYPDGQDDFGRSDVPYFLAYYLAAPMTAELLTALWICLKKGPLFCPNRHSDVPTLEPTIIQNVHQYIPARPGAAIAPQLWEQGYQRLKTKEMITLFSVHDERDQHFVPPLSGTEIAEGTFGHPSGQTDLQQGTKKVVSMHPERSLPSALNSHEPTLVREPKGENRSTSDLNGILQDLLAKPIDIQGAVLVSAEGHPITIPFGLGEHSASMLAGAMLYLAHQTCEELSWKASDTVSVRSPEGCIFLSYCHGDIYLLVKAGKVPLGLLEGEVNRTLTRLRSVIATPAASLPPIPKSSVPVESVTILQESSPPPELLEPPPELDVHEPQTMIIPDSEITYRGRRTGS
jgi:predicted regulator of Ras-like GTPase activity (Roadblock/LC7/MglB family)